MSWNTENTDPIGDLTRMKEAIEAAPQYKVYVNPIDMEQPKVSTLLWETPFVFVDDHVPVGYILLGDRLIEIEALMAMYRPYEEAMSICYDLGKSKELPLPQPRNRAERRAAMKQRKRDNRYEYKKNS